MTSEDSHTIRHPAENRLLAQAVQGEAHAAANLLQYLSSSNPYLRQIILETIHDGTCPEAWQRLLSCLATHCWKDLPEYERFGDPLAAERIDRSMMAAFAKDESQAEKEHKQAVLQAALEQPGRVEYTAAACLMGLRGEAIALPALKQVLRSGSEHWQVRAAEALGAMGSEAAGIALLDALPSKRSPVHKAANLALRHLGKQALPAWEQALEFGDYHLRWHAARALGELGDRRAVGLLAEGLSDENSQVRWASAEALAHLGQAALPSVLKMLCRPDLNENALQAAHHALHILSHHDTLKALQPLLIALNSSAAHTQAPVLAARLLKEMKTE